MQRRVGLPILFLFTVATSTAWAGEFDTELLVRSTATGGYTVEVRMNEGAADEFLLDTGSAYVAVDQRTLQRLRGQDDLSLVKHVSALLADGSRRTVPIYNVKRITLGEACHLQDVEVAVMPSNSVPILGLSALKQLAPFAIYASPPMLRVSDCAAI